MIYIYTQDNCPACVSVKQRLSAAGFSYEEQAIDKNPDIKAWVIKQGHRSVPVIYKDGLHVKNVDDILKEKTNG